VAKKANWDFLETGVTLFIVLVAPVLWIGELPGVAQALGEYLHPTTLWGNYLPRGCTVTSEAPPSDLARIVESQKNLYHLALQKVVVCRTAERLLGFEKRYAGFPVGDRDPCRPLRGGCCTCQSGRHVVVMAADGSEKGSVLVRANLIQSRWDYLQHKWKNVRPWAWRWCAIVALLLVGARLIVLAGGALVRPVRSASRGKTDSGTGGT
jgi:hypothetical protein